MADLKEILRIDDRALEFLRDIDIIKALETLVDTFQKQRQQLEEFEVSDVFDLIESIEDDDELFAALEDLGVDAQQVRDEVARISDALGGISEDQRQLLEPLSEFDGTDPGLIDWDILDVGADAANTAAVEFSFDVGADTSLEFEAAATWPTDAIADSMLRIGLDGNLKANANLSVPLKLGALGVSTANTATAKLGYFFDPTKNDEIYAAAVWRRLDDLCNPFSLDSVWRNAGSSDLRGVLATSKGSASLQLEIGIAESFTIAEELAKAEAGLTVSANVRRAADSELTIVAVPDSSGTPERLDVTLSRESLRESGRKLELKVEIDVSGLAKRLREILSKHLQDFQAFYEEYEDYLTPGTYIRDQLGDELAKRIEAVTSDPQIEGILKQAVESSLGKGDGAALPALDAFLKEEITTRLDEAGEVVTGEATKVAREVVRKISDKLKLDAAAVIASLETEVGTLVTGLRTGLEKKVFEATGDTLGRLEKAIEKAGVEVSGAVATADEALEGVLEFIGRYERRLTRLIDHTKDAAKTRITAKLTHEETLTSGRTIDAKLSIFANTPAAQRAFDNLVRGDMNGVLEDLNAGSDDFRYDTEGTALSMYARSHERLGFEAVILGFDVGSETVFDANAHVTSDGAGRVSVVSDATWRKLKRAGREKRELTFVDAFELAAASSTRQFSVDLGISHQDEKLNVDELKSFLKRFQHAGLLPAGTTDGAASLLRDWIGTGGGKEIEADINLGLSLSEEGSSRLLRLEEHPSGELPPEEQRRLFQLALESLQRSGRPKPKRIKQWAKFLRKEVGIQAESDYDAIFAYNARMHDKTLRTETIGSAAPRILHTLRAIHRLNEAGVSYVELIEQMRRIYLSTPSLSGDDGWTAEQYRKAQSKLSDHLRAWFRINGRFLLWIAKKAHRRTVAFVTALITTAGSDGDDAPALTLTLVRRDGTDDRETLT